VERVSYEVMTPSAARGILEAIFWKPEFRWRLHEIRILPTASRDADGVPTEHTEHRVKHYSILRNEMNSVQSDRAARGWERNGGGYFADHDRAQRHTLCLRAVAYVIRAEMELRPHATDDVAKYRDQFRRRVKKGQCFTQPYLGTREFSAFFGPPNDEEPMAFTDDLGLVLFDVAFERAERGALEYASHGAGGREISSGDARPVFFQARIEDGVMAVPPHLYEGGGS
jgi:CRISPR-associated protein Cas5d